ncbi:MAG: 3-methyl-2-oxobutanoate hydroxymethyltransferase [Deltaproteobacteria bacterium]|nr:3-methyl-2-oxobutanoate hydroxymethyltransferase [Deltaproteobacteria bacterium]
MSFHPRPPAASVAASSHESRVTVRTLAARKRRGEKLTMLTAYDFAFARILDAAGIDLLLVGDSLGNVVQGHDTTLPVTLDEVVYHTRLVARGARRAMVIGDMPFGSYQVSPEDAVRSAIRLVKEGGAQAVKLEGGVAAAPAITRIARAEIPVFGHVGLTPQAVHRMGGFRVQGRTDDERARVLADAQAVEEAGAVAVVLEGMPAELAADVTRKLAIPTIGIGAGPACDGQVLVLHDMLGLDDRAPSFVKQFADLGAAAARAARAFADEVTSGKFPAEEHCYRAR